MRTTAQDATTKYLLVQYWPHWCKHITHVQLNPVQLKIFVSIQILKGFGRDYILWRKDWLIRKHDFTVSISSNIPSIFIPLFVYYSFKINDTSRWDLELVQILLFINFVEVFFQTEYIFFEKSNSIYLKFCEKNQYFGQYFKSLTEILYFLKFHFKFWDKTLNITWILRNWHHS